MVRETYTKPHRNRGYVVELIRIQPLDLEIIAVMMPTMGRLKFYQTLSATVTGVAAILVAGQPAWVKEWSRTMLIFSQEKSASFTNLSTR